MKEYGKLGLNFNMTRMSTHTPSEDKDEVAKVECYSSLEKVCDAFSNTT